MVKDEHSNPRDLVIIEKYRAAMTYLYDRFQDFPRRHGALREMMVEQAAAIVGSLYHALKSKQLTRLYAADAELAALRFWLDFAADRRLISHHQHQVALRHLAEVGAILGQWIKTAKGNGR